MDMKHNGSTAQSDAAGAYASGGPLILIADASPSSRDTLSADLVRLAYRVSAVESGSAALMMLRSERPALLLLDQNMPWLPGTDLLTAIRRRWENAQRRSEARPGGKDCVRSCRPRATPYHKKKKITES